MFNHFLCAYHSCLRIKSIDEQMRPVIPRKASNEGVDLGVAVFEGVGVGDGAANTWRLFVEASAQLTVLLE